MNVVLTSDPFPDPLFKRAAIRKVKLNLPDGAQRDVRVIENETGQCYEIGRQLKKAIYGQVVHALELSSVGNDQYVRTNREMAIKVYSKKILRQAAGRSQEDPLKEIAALQFIGDNHPNIMGQIECCADEDNIYSVMRFCPGGELFDFIEENGPMDEKQAREMFIQMITALVRLSELGIGHRDMSLENVLFDNKDLYIIIDFGMCMKLTRNTAVDESAVVKFVQGHRVVDSSAYYMIARHGICGKRNYVSPEVLRQDEVFNPLLCDVWAAGVILFMLLTGVPPVETATFADERYGMICANNLAGLLRAWRMQLSPGVTDLIQNMLRPNPSDRLTLAQILEHPWVTGA